MSSTHGKICTNKQNSLDEESSTVDNEFGGLIGSTEYLSDGVKCPENSYEMDVNQQDGQLLMQESVASLEDNEYFLMNNDCNTDTLVNTSRQEESFLLNTEMGTVSVTLNDLIDVGVDINTELININAEQTNALLRLVQNRDQHPSNNIEYVSNFETVDDPPKTIDEKNTNKDALKQAVNFYAYIEENGDVLLVEEETDKQVAKFNQEELKKHGILDVNNVTDAELQRLAQVALDPGRQAHSSQPLNGNLPSCSSNDSSPIASKKFRIGHYIGEEVEIVNEKFQTPRRATIRYMRKNGMFKVQLDTGEFEWVDNLRIIKCGSQTSKQQKHVNKNKRQYEKHLITTDQTTKSTDKLPCTSECCALCDKRIQTKPAFIVIRLPACRECSETKAMMVENTLNSMIQDEVIPNNPSNLISRKRQLDSDSKPPTSDSKRTSITQVE